MKNKKILIPIIIVVAILILIVTAALAVLSGKENGDLSDTENQTEPVSLSSQEINDYNVSITNSIGLGRSIIGSDVYAIIDKIIERLLSNLFILYLLFLNLVFLLFICPITNNLFS